MLSDQAQRTAYNRTLPSRVADGIGDVGRAVAEIHTYGRADPPPSSRWSDYTGAMVIATVLFAMVTIVPIFLGFQVDPSAVDKQDLDLRAAVILRAVLFCCITLVYVAVMGVLILLRLTR